MLNSIYYTLGYSSSCSSSLNILNGILSICCGDCSGEYALNCIYFAQLVTVGDGNVGLCSPIAF